MLSINYKGITPQQRFFKISVIGNNNADKIKFIVPTIQNDVNLSSLTPYIKVESAGATYIDKIRAVATQDGENIVIVWTMTRKSLTCRNLAVQLQFEDTANGNDIVWQSMIANIELENTINADKEISDKYPTILQQLQGQIEEMKQSVESKLSINDYDILPIESELHYHEIARVGNEAYIETSFDRGFEFLAMNSQSNNQEVKTSNIANNLNPKNPLLFDLSITYLEKVYTSVVNMPFENFKGFRLGTGTLRGAIGFYRKNEQEGAFKRIKVRYSHYFAYNPTTGAITGDANATIIINNKTIILPTAERESKLLYIYEYEVEPDRLDSLISISTIAGEGRVFIHSIEVATEEEGIKGYKWNKINIEEVLS